MDDPRLDLGELVLHLDHAHVVEDADHALEERGISAGERARRVDEVLDALGVAARGEEVLHDARRVGVAERRELDDLVARAPVLRPAVALRDHVGACEAQHEDRRVDAADEVLEEVERLFVREVQVVEHEDDRTLRLLQDEVRVGLEEALDDRAAEEPHLQRVATHRLDQRRIEELELEELTEEVADVTDLAVLEHARDLRADLRLRGLAVHALDDAEASAEDAREDVVGGALIARRAAEDARRAVLGGALLREEIADEPRLADAVGADERDGAGPAVVAHRAQRFVEDAELGRSTDEHSAPVDRSEARRGE